MKNLILIIVACLLCYGIYWAIKDQQWKEANCEKIYYKRKTKVCVKYGTRPIMAGKVVVVQRYCMEYKDTLVLDWKYKCPEKP